MNEGQDGKINTKGAEKKGRQNWKRKGLKEKKKFWKEEEEKEKGRKIKGKKGREGSISSLKEEMKFMEGKLEEGKGNIKTETVNYNYLLC